MREYRESGILFLTLNLKPMNKFNIIGKKVKIISDNENYDKFRKKTLICTYASNEGKGYDDSVYPQLLCDFKTLDGKEFPFALYEYEFEIID